MNLPDTERRMKARVQLTRGLLARFGTMGVLILDITDAGARIEHFNRLDVHKVSAFRFDWQGKPVETTAEIVACKMHRFATDDSGSNVFHSGLSFIDYAPKARVILRDMVATIIARSLAEQVANARGLGPVLESEKNMPVFRSGTVVASADQGYIRCTLVGGTRFEKKWSRTAEQPAEGFTVSATEPRELIDQLCDSYVKGDAEQRQLIIALAAASVDNR